MLLEYPVYAELLDLAGIFYMGHMTVPLERFEQGVLKTDYLEGVRKFYCVGQYDGKFTVASAARAWNFTQAVPDSWFGITFGGRHRHFGEGMNFVMDDIEIFETSNTESTVHGKLREYFMFFLFNLQDRLELEQSYFDAEIRPIMNELAMERRFTTLEGDLDNPDQSQIEVPLNPQIQKMFCEDAIESIPGRSCVVEHEWRPEYGVGDGEGSDYEDIANSKPKVRYDEQNDAMIIESYSHDYHQPHPGYTFPPPGTLGNASSIDLVFKFKNRKFIARAAGISDWESVPEDTCDEIIQLFEAQALQTLAESKNGAQHLEKYAQYGCQHKLVPERDTFGIFWLNSPMKYEYKDGKLEMEPNRFYTDETNTPEENLDRLGGMLYCRVVGPARFIEWILVDSFRRRNLRLC
ncbi:Oidioi.mRNA.OKI2018_I69.PAR.g8946.t1.cds [Oikopleura dioica]|uniref:Oidioi.mRNA.OKI2018_I69.PAR.g8946.t1.cds n=1 Tax=Oikopleura dioica TaxID=34765 RepID=A0ABN7RQU9_OIKDI|nr:Oidioi.mRNA.OKI2018_I69.PAR.g8946.t1.cds [Oikopleura dioica]